jgi:hypothetical protein
MWSQPAFTSAGTGPDFATSLASRDWALLVRLPPRVLAAVLAVPVDPPPVSAGLAGLAAIASARASTHPGGSLAREVAIAIFASDEPPRPPEFPVQEVVCAECAGAGHVLAQRVPANEAEEYRNWVRRIGVAALATAVHDDPIGAAQLRLLDECGRALAG